MAIPVGTSELKLYRRHTAHCTRFPGIKNKPETCKPNSKKEKLEDTCNCPIWCRGYLAKETEIVNGRLRPKRVFGSLGCTDWTPAEREMAKLYERGRFPSAEAGTKAKDSGAVTIRFAVDRYLTSRKDSSCDPIGKDTHNHYASLLDQRLIPFCAERDILYIRDFESTDLCKQFTESWQQLRRNAGEFLAMSTRRTELQRFRTFLKSCVDNDWMAKSGAQKIKMKNSNGAAEGERFGLELWEYRQMLNAPGSANLSAQENQETRVATELMRWTGLRISDAHKFNDAEIVSNETGDGWNADFIQKKTKQRCISPLPDHVVNMLRALPGRIENGRKYFFTCTYTALRERVDTLAVRAQKEKPFLHPFSPHCLRHTFAIQHLNHGTDISFVSKWLGHKSVAITLSHYGNWIKSTKQIAEERSRGANARMMAAMSQISTDLTNSSATPLGT